jgi:hypothetical protein
VLLSKAKVGGGKWSCQVLDCPSFRAPENSKGPQAFEAPTSREAPKEGLVPMASVNITVKATHKSTVLPFPTAPSAITTRKKKQPNNMVGKLIVMPKSGVCPTCDEPANVDDGALCKDCGAFLCDHPKCACSCDRIQKIAERTARHMLAHPKQYGLQKLDTLTIS